MKYILLVLLIHGVLGQRPFGPSYLRNSKLCQPWSCMYNKLGFSGDAPVSKESYSAAIKKLFPESWHDAVEKSLDICYGTAKSRRYTNTCPGQAAMHCFVDNLVNECPEQAVSEEDRCAPVASLAGFKYMFSQSRYENLERNIPLEKRPVWFLKNYFSAKCCNFPELFSVEELSECGFNSLMFYFGHKPKPRVTTVVYPKIKKVIYKPEAVHVKTPTVAMSANDDDGFDPLSCCDMSSLIPSSASSCGFTPAWGPRRLTLANHDVPAVTTQQPVVETQHDIKITPVSCETNTCVFTKLNVLESNGDINVEEASRLLAKYGDKHPEWRKAAATATRKCLSHPSLDYKSDCRINTVLSCVFDVLSENCPSHKKTWKDPCRHAHGLKKDTLCQINSSKYGPKNRRTFCDFPRLADPSVLSVCNATSVNRLEAVPLPPPPPRKSWLTAQTCTDTLPSTKCLLSEMGVLNRYNFMDYFKMKELIRNFTLDADWSAMQSVYLGVLSTAPLYRDHCMTQRKLLNVLDTVLMTCPTNKRKNTEQCNNMFEEITKNNTTPAPPNSIANYDKSTTKVIDPNAKPIIRIISIHPAIMKKKHKKPLVILPVYQRPQFQHTLPTDLNGHPRPFHSDSLLRGGMTIPVMNEDDIEGELATPI